MFLCADFYSQFILISVVIYNYFPCQLLCMDCSCFYRNMRYTIYFLFYISFLIWALTVLSLCHKPTFISLKGLICSKTIDVWFQKFYISSRFLLWTVDLWSMSCLISVYLNSFYCVDLYLYSVVIWQEE